MESPLALLFKAIQNQISSEVEEIKLIDQNLAQYLNEDKRKSMLFPCVLIDFPNCDFTALQGNIQLANLTISLSLFFDVWNGTHNTAPDTVIEAGLNYLEIEHKVFSCLQGFSTNFTTPFVRTNSKSQNINDVGLIVKEMTLTTSYEDWTLNNDNYVSLGIANGN